MRKIGLDSPIPHRGRLGPRASARSRTTCSCSTSIRVGFARDRGRPRRSCTGRDGRAMRARSKPTRRPAGAVDHPGDPPANRRFRDRSALPVRDHRAQPCRPAIRRRDRPGPEGRVSQSAGAGIPRLISGPPVRIILSRAPSPCTLGGTWPDPNSDPISELLRSGGPSRSASSPSRLLP